jgi:nucleotide-binding universal stress UspA family protein
MTAATPQRWLPIDHVFHPTDLSRASEVAFAHALRLALAARATLTIFHVAGPEENVPWSEFPSVRGMLEGWGLLPPGSPKDAVPALGIEVEKIAAHDEDVVQASLSYLAGFPAQLVVLATHGLEGLPRWFARAVAEPLARATQASTLFVPHGARGFVAPDDGRVSLAQVVVPVDKAPRPQAAVNIADGVAAALEAEPDLHLLHVGSPDDAPALRIPRSSRARWNRVERTGDVVEEIATLANGLPADLVVMATAGRNGFLDALRGSTTERVLRRLACPLLAIPEER